MPGVKRAALAALLLAGCRHNQRHAIVPTDTEEGRRCLQNGTIWEVTCRHSCTGRADWGVCYSSCRSGANQIYMTCPGARMSDDNGRDALATPP